jgi:hypothetical protein
LHLASQFFKEQGKGSEEFEQIVDIQLYSPFLQGDFRTENKN